MKLEINIRLDVGGKNFTDKQFERRANTVVNALSKLGTVEHRVQRLWRGQPRHLVALIEVQKYPEKALLALAVRMKQDCLSVFNPEDGTGRLIGPRPSEWEPFDKEEFERLEKSLNRKFQPYVKPVYKPSDDPAVEKARMDAMRARYLTVFPDSVWNTFVQQQVNMVNRMIGEILEKEGPEALTIPRFEGVLEMVTEHLWSPAHSAMFGVPRTEERDAGGRSPHDL